MKDKTEFDNYMREGMSKTYSSPSDLNNNLILNSQNKEKLALINLIFFIIMILQSASIISIGIIFVSDIFIKLITIGIGIILFNTSLVIYTIITNKEGVLI